MVIVLHIKLGGMPPSYIYAVMFGAIRLWCWSWFLTIAVTWDNIIHTVLHSRALCLPRRRRRIWYAPHVVRAAPA